MIVVYTGTPGSSKTLHAVHDIRYALTKPGGPDQPVIANFDINRDVPLRRMDAFHYFDNRKITPRMLTDFADDFWANGGARFQEDYLLLVLDECQLIFNARSWQDKGRGRGDSRLDWLEFLSQHRKYGYKIILITQSSKMIDNQFRMLIDLEVNHRAFKNFGFFGSLVDALPIGDWFFWVKTLYQTREPLGLRVYRRTRRDSVLYDSYARLEKVMDSPRLVEPKPLRSTRR